MIVSMADTFRHASSFEIAKVAPVWRWQDHAHWPAGNWKLRLQIQLLSRDSPI
jgi:hypothetical protein